MYISKISSLMAAIIISCAFSLNAYADEESEPSDKSDPFKRIVEDNKLMPSNNDDENSPNIEDSRRRSADEFDTGEMTDAVIENIAGIENAKNPDSEGYKKVAKISALDKITGKSKQIIIPVGKSEIFGNVEISVKKCWKSTLPELYSKILTKIVENKVDEDPKEIFHGWLISNNPSISTITHHTYEVFAIDCFDNAASANQGASPIAGSHPNPGSNHKKDAKNGIKPQKKK